MNKKLYRLISVFIVFFTVFLININAANAKTINRDEYCKNPSSSTFIVNGHYCPDSQHVYECMDGVVSDEMLGFPSKCEVEDEKAGGCKKGEYYYTLLDVDDKTFDSANNSFAYSLMLCNGLEKDGIKINYRYALGNSETIASVEDKYPDFYKKVKKDIEKGVADSEMGKEEAKKDDKSANESTIERIDTIGNLDENEKNISISCKDFSVFHTIYVIILILAPIMVIILGSIDFAKAVMTSDVDKMSKFKAKFPKRLLALVLLVLTPLVIKLIVSLNQSLNSTLMTCIVNGSDAEIKLNAAKIDYSKSSKNKTKDTNPDLTTACTNTCGSSNFCISYCVKNYNKKCQGNSDTKARATCYQKYAKEVVEKYKKQNTKK